MVRNLTVGTVDRAVDRKGKTAVLFSGSGLAATKERISPVV